MIKCFKFWTKFFVINISWYTCGGRERKEKKMIQYWDYELKIQNITY